MKLTNDIVKALNNYIEDSSESVSDFARLANISANTISKYMRKETETIKDETWGKLYPFLKPYLPKKGASNDQTKRPLELTADQKVLLDAFQDLPKDVQRQKLFEIIELAKKELREKNQSLI